VESVALNAERVRDIVTQSRDTFTLLAEYWLDFRFRSKTRVSLTCLKAYAIIHLAPSFLVLKRRQEKSTFISLTQINMQVLLLLLLT